jgi:hypothetical protein
MGSQPLPASSPFDGVHCLISAMQQRFDGFAMPGGRLAMPIRGKALDYGPNRRCRRALPVR